MTYHCIHHHILNGGVKWVSLSDPAVAFEWGEIVSPFLGHNGEVFPVVVEEAFRTWGYPATDEDFHPALSIEGVVGFP